MRKRQKTVEPEDCAKSDRLERTVRKELIMKKILVSHEETSELSGNQRQPIEFYPDATRFPDLISNYLNRSGSLLDSIRTVSDQAMRLHYSNARFGGIFPATSERFDSLSST